MHMYQLLDINVWYQLLDKDKLSEIISTIRNLNSYDNYLSIEFSPRPATELKS